MLRCRHWYRHHRHRCFCRPQGTRRRRAECAPCTTPPPPAHPNVNTLNYPTAPATSVRASLHMTLCVYDEDESVVATIARKAKKFLPRTGYRPQRPRTSQRTRAPTHLILESQGRRPLSLRQVGRRWFTAKGNRGGATVIEMLLERVTCSGMVQAALCPQSTRTSNLQLLEVFTVLYGVKSMHLFQDGQ
jgi:hypothetical protein